MQTPSKSNRSNNHIVDPHKYHQKCVCNICTCGTCGPMVGKHTCPEKSMKFEGETTHNHYYKPYEIVPDQTEKFAYNPEQKHYDPNLIKSTYNSTYTPKPIERQQQLQGGYQYQPTRGRFEDETEYKKNYVPSQIVADRPMQAMKYVGNSAKFQGSTTYNREFSPKPATQEHVSRRYEYKPSNVPFQGKTTYESEYKAHKIEPFRLDTSHQYQSRNTPFVGESRYKQEYVPHKIEVPEVCPTELLPSRPLRCSPGKEHLHYTASRNQWE